MSKILSTEINNKIPTGGMPTVMSIVDKTITPSPGTAGVPIEAGGYHFYSLSINSLTLGGSGDNPFLFLISEIISDNLDLGSSAHDLK